MLKNWRTVAKPVFAYIGYVTCTRERERNYEAAAIACKYTMKHGGWEYFFGVPGSNRGIIGFHNMIQESLRVCTFFSQIYFNIFWYTFIIIKNPINILATFLWARQIWILI